VLKKRKEQSNKTTKKVANSDILRIRSEPHTTHVDRSLPSLEYKVTLHVADVYVVIHPMSRSDRFSSFSSTVGRKYQFSYI